jgi:hypothetical protein
MTNTYIVPDVAGDQLVEVPGVGLVRNDKSEIVSAHPRKEDQVPTHEELAADLEGLTVKELKKLAGHAQIEGRGSMDREQLIDALSSPIVPEPVDLDELLDLPLPVEEEPETPVAEDTTGGDQ